MRWKAVCGGPLPQAISKPAAHGPLTIKAPRGFLGGSPQKPPEYWWSSWRTSLNAATYTAMWRRKLRHSWMLATLSNTRAEWRTLRTSFSALAFRVNRVKTKSNSLFVSNCSIDTMSPIVCMSYRFLKHFTSQMLFLVKSLWPNVVNRLLCPSCHEQKMSLVPHQENRKSHSFIYK